MVNPLVCNSVNKCVDPFDANKYTLAPADGTCPTIPTCTYCEDKTNSNILHPMTAGGGCPAAADGPLTKPPNAEGKCKEVVLCIYCIDKTDPSKLVSINLDDKTCPASATSTTPTETIPEQTGPRAGQCRESVSQADFDGMLMLDYSGSLDIGYDDGSVKNPENYYTAEVLLADEVVTTFNTGLGGKPSAAFRMGGFTWSSGITTPTVVMGRGKGGFIIDLTTDVTGIGAKMIATKDQTPTGGTYYANAFAKCALEVLDETKGASSKKGAFKMCMLLTDGLNNDDNFCSATVCGNFCAAHQRPKTNCNLDSIAMAAKSKGVTIVTVFIARGAKSSGDDVLQKLFCYSSGTDKEPADCIADFPDLNNGVQAAGAKKQQDDSPFFLKGDLTDQVRAAGCRCLPFASICVCCFLIRLSPLRTFHPYHGTPHPFLTPHPSCSFYVYFKVKLSADLKSLVTQIVSTVGTSSASGGTNATKTVPGSKTETAIVGQGSSSPVVGAAVAAVTKDDQKGADGTFEQGCQDPVHLWLLIFFLPLILYLLYYPWKRRQDAIKRR